MIVHTIFQDVGAITCRCVQRRILVTRNYKNARTHLPKAALGISKKIAIAKRFALHSNAIKPLRGRVLVAKTKAISHYVVKFVEGSSHSFSVYSMHQLV